MEAHQAEVEDRTELLRLALAPLVEVMLTTSALLDDWRAAKPMQRVQIGAQ